MFESRIDKMFCSLDCYTKSAQFRDMLAENLEKASSSESIQRRAQAAKLGQDVPCLECGTVFYQKRPSKGRPARKFCDTGCYRSYLAKRFDRWVANPEGMALPQCYDEFLDKEELSCVVDGCDWRGSHLTLHMNQAHGVKADEFKRAAGFNLTTGVIAKPLATALRERKPVGVALMGEVERADVMELAREGSGSYIRYKSLEGCEHAKKARSMMGPGPDRICKGCGQSFQQSTPIGRALYCTTSCRSDDYAQQRRSKKESRVKNQDGTANDQSA
jgi:hypothetical protein